MRMAFLGACALLLAGCSGANVLYLHSAEENAALSEAVAGLEASRVSHIAMIADQKTFLDAAHKRDADIIVTRELAFRDFYLGRMVAGDWRKEFDERLEESSKRLLGDKDAIRKNTASIKQATGPINRQVQKQIERLRNDLNERILFFEEQGGVLGKGDRCLAGAPLVSGPMSDPAAAPLLDDVNTSCNEIRKHLATAKVFDSPILEPATPAECGLAENARDTDPKRCKGALAQVDVMLANAKLARSAQKEIIKNLKDGLAEAVANHAAAEAAELPSIELERNVCRAASLLNGLIVDLEGGAAFDKEVGSHCGAADKADEEKAQERNEDLAAFLDLAKAAPVEAQIAAALRAFKAETVGGKATEVLSALATQTSGAPVETESKTARSAIAIVRIIGGLQDFVTAEDRPSVAAMTIVLVANQAAARAARIEADFLNKKIEMLELRRTAIRSEIALLARAQTMRKGGERLKTIRRYADSWTRGRIQSDLAELNMVAARRAAWLQREEAATTAAYGVISPALGELARFSEGGIKPELIAQLLGAVGISAIAFGVN